MHPGLIRRTPSSSLISGSCVCPYSAMSHSFSFAARTSLSVPLFTPYLCPWQANTRRPSTSRITSLSPPKKSLFPARTYVFSGYCRMIWRASDAMSPKWTIKSHSASTVAILSRGAVLRCVSEMTTIVFTAFLPISQRAPQAPSPCAKRHFFPRRPPFRSSFSDRR